MRADEYFRGIDELKKKLDKIINLLECLSTQYTQIVPGTEVYDPVPVCICSKYKPGELTAGWWCPIHGHNQ